MSFSTCVVFLCHLSLLRLLVFLHTHHLCLEVRATVGIGVRFGFEDIPWATTHFHKYHGYVSSGPRLMNHGMHARTRTHARTHARKHARTHARTHSRTHTLTLTNARTRARARAVKKHAARDARIVH